MNEIIPAILPKDVKDLETKAGQLPPEIPFVHLDVLEEDIWAPINKDFEAHLMVENPSQIIDKWTERGAKRIIVHSLGGSTAKFRGQIEIGLGVELDVPLEEIFPLVSEVDFIHLMSIAEMGGQGRPLNEAIFDRIKKLKEKFPHLPISVDGGISLDNFKQLQEAGADRLIVGSHFREIWNSLMKE